MMLDNLLLVALAGLLLAAYWDNRPQLQYLLSSAGKQVNGRNAVKAFTYFFARRKSSGRSKRHGTKRSLGGGKWELRAELPRKLDGSRRRTYEVFEGTSRDADRRLAEILDEVDTLAVTERPETVGELLDRWLTSEVEPTVREATYLDYKRRAEIYVRPLIGKVKLKELTLAKAEAFRNELQKRPLKGRAPAESTSPKQKRQEATAKISQTTVKGALKVLSMALNYARRHKYVATNVLHDLKRKQWDASEEKRRALTAPELKAFMRAARGNYWHSLFALLAVTGIRPSEALGLKWEDIDWKSDWIHIKRKLTLLPEGRYKFDPPKTQSSKRDVPLSDKTRVILEAHLKRQEELQAYDPELDLVFGDLDGQPADSRNILRRHVKPLALKAGIGRSATLYSFRHTFMTLSTNRTGEPKLTSRVMGHKDVTFSQNVYNDPDDEELRESTRSMDEFLDEDDESEAGAEAA